MRILIFITLIWHLAKSEKTSLQKLSDDLGILSKILNTISLQNTLTSSDAILEFLPIPKTLTTSEFQSLQNIQNFQMSTSELESLNSTLSVLAIWRHRDFDDVSNFSIFLQNIGEMQRDSNVFWSALEMAEDVGILDFMKTLNSLDDFGSLNMEGIAEKFAIFDGKWKTEFRELLDFQNHYNSILMPIQNLFDLSQDYREKFNSEFSKNLQKFENSDVKLLQNFKNSEFFNDVKSLQNILDDVPKDSRDEFRIPKSPEALDALLKSTWFLDSIVQMHNPFEGVKKLQNALEDVVKVLERLKTLDVDFQAILNSRNSGDLKGIVENQQFLTSSDFSQLDGSFQEFQSHLEPLLEVTMNSDDVEKFRNFFKASKRLNEDVTRILKTFEDLTMKFQDFSENSGNSMILEIQNISESTQNPEDVKNLPKFNEFLEFLNSTLSLLKPFGNRQFRSQVDRFPLDLTSSDVQNLQSNLEDVGVLKTLRNLKNMEDVTFQEVKRSVTMASSLQKLRNGSGGLLRSIQNVKTFVKTSGSSGVKNSLKTFEAPKLQSFQEGFRILKAASEFHVNILNSGASSHLKRSLEDVEQKSTGIIQKLASQNPINFLIYQEIFEALGKIATSPEDVKLLTLDFTSSESKQKLKKTEVEIPEIRRFFDDFLGIKERVASRRKQMEMEEMEEGKKGKMGILFLIAILVLIATIVCIGVGSFAVVFYRNQKRKKTELTLSNPETYLLMLFTPENQLELHDGVWGNKARMLMMTRSRDFGAFRRIIKRGCYLDARAQSNHSANTLLHDSVLLSLPKHTKCLLSHGADPKLLNHEYKTPIQLAKRSGNRKMMTIFRQFRRKKDILKVVPRRVKGVKFVVEVEKTVDGKEKEQFLSKFRNNIHPHSTSTHVIVKTDKHRDLHVTESLLPLIFSPKMLMSHLWMGACLQNTRRFQENREFRVRNLIYKSEVFENLETIKTFFNKCKVPFLCGTNVSFHSKEHGNWNSIKSTCDQMMANTSTKKFPPSTPLEGNQYYREDLGRNWLIYRKEVAACIPTIYNKHYIDKRFAWFSDDDFIGFLLDFTIHCDRLKMSNEKEEVSRNSDYEVDTHPIKTVSKTTSSKTSKTASKSTSKTAKSPTSSSTNAPPPPPKSVGTHYENLTPLPRIQKTLSKKKASFSRTSRKRRRTNRRKKAKKL